MDGNGHGSHVAGTAAGALFGVAKEANLIAVRVLDRCVVLCAVLCCAVLCAGAVGFLVSARGSWVQFSVWECRQSVWLSLLMSLVLLL